MHRVKYLGKKLSGVVFFLGGGGKLYFNTIIKLIESLVQTYYCDREKKKEIYSVLSNLALYNDSFGLMSDFITVNIPMMHI